MGRVPIEQFLQAVCDRLAGQPGVLGIALVGSHARGEARPDSDIDLILVCDDPAALLADRAWVEKFEEVQSAQVEDWGLCTSLRVFYANGPEVEFGIVPEQWTALPPDPGTAKVVCEGMRILFDPQGILAQLMDAISAQS